MQTLVISDTTSLILFDKIGKLDLLQKLFNQVTITSKIADEFKKKLPEWITIKDPENTNQLLTLAKSLDLGEASALALSLETGNCLLILDDLKARKLAEGLKLKFTGSIGILLLAQRKGLINNMDEIISIILSTDFRLTNALILKLKSG
jgi:predicted nucleic acid-binding protein